ELLREEADERSRRRARGDRGEDLGLQRCQPLGRGDGLPERPLATRQPIEGRGDRRRERVRRWVAVGCHHSSGLYGRAQRTTDSITALNQAWYIASTLSGSAPPAARKSWIVTVIGTARAMRWRSSTWPDGDETPSVWFF